ncbi:MAG TPA: dihydrolipoamide acetyltransferase family protein [Polyangiales bacterium]|jgi:pyruvate dehydrogenase E2 component (dihydrolipoamide acetyltransferase)|nr:dihydrolipoamide acetyltransferase family protein [Polyangiales bacterium]
MARFEFKLPDIGEGVTEGEIVAWHVKEGDQVGEDQVMVEVMTDKATVTIGAPKTGKIEELRAQVGSTVKVGEVLVVIHTGNGSRAIGGHPSKMPAGPTASAVGDIQESLPGTSYFAEKRARAVETQDDVVAKGKPGHFAEHPLATPATRKLARDLEIDLRTVPPTGEGGRVTKDDVRAASTASGSLESPVARPQRAREIQPRPVVRDAADQRVPFVGVRRKIAERMQQSKNTAAHFTFVEECDASRIVELRDKLKPEAQARGVELTFMPFLIKAVCAALKKNPMLNASLDVEKNEIVMHGRCHIGMAAATEQGLVVPVIHDADTMDLFQLAAEVKRLGDAARDNKLQVSELTGSTFTITSLGKLGGLFAVPIVNLPNVGILGVHRIKEKPVVKNGVIAIGQIMLLSLSLDHRVVDGHVGAAFAYDVIANLEEPALMFI